MSKTKWGLIHWEWYLVSLFTFLTSNSFVFLSLSADFLLCIQYGYLYIGGLNAFLFLVQKKKKNCEVHFTVEEINCLDH